MQYHLRVIKIKEITNFLTTSCFHQSIRTMCDTASSLLTRSRSIIPPLRNESHKGESGRIGIVGGSAEYTGAPYFAAIAALRVGADLVHVFCPNAASPIIKSYSPELIVHPLLDSPTALDQMKPWLDRLHVLVIGPGLGRESAVLQTISELIRFCREIQKPIIIDADGLFLLTQDINLVKDYNGAILTPNAIEFLRLFGNERENVTQSMQKLGSGVTVLEKGLHDRIYDSGTSQVIECPPGGSQRRCGGQGDLLVGACAVYLHWAKLAKDPNPSVVACFAASLLIKECNKLAFAVNGRSSITTDMIQYIHPAFSSIFETQ